MNHDVAVAMADGPEAGLQMVERIDATLKLDEYYLFHATKADLFRRLGASQSAVGCYSRAISLSGNIRETECLSEEAK